MAVEDRMKFEHQINEIVTKVNSVLNIDLSSSFSSDSLACISTKVSLNPFSLI